tara:strand:- start:923 stop:1570 length:648 start_codon:yes stop_codon:yes gene_type:complete
MTDKIEGEEGKKDDGVVTFTQEEVDAKLKEGQEAFDAKMVEKDTAMTTLEKDKADLEAKIGETKEDHPNFKTLKEALSTKGKELDDFKAEVEGDKKQQREDAMNTKISAVTSGDEEREKKIKLHLTNTLSGMPETNETERQAKFDAALKLSSEYSNDNPQILDSIMQDTGSAGAGDGQSDSKVQFTTREKSLGSKLGISNEDYKKYGPRLHNKGK